MSNYNKYAKDLNKAFLKAREAYKEEAKVLDIAERFAGKGETDAERTASQERYNRAKADFRHSTRDIWGGFTSEARAIREALKQHVDRDNMADPRAIDTNALELLKTGTLSPAEFENIAGTFKENPTMSKLIAHYAAQQADSTADPLEKSKYNTVAVALRNAPNAVMEKFDALVQVADYCSGHGTQGSFNRSSYVQTMADKWESFAGEAVDLF